MANIKQLYEDNNKTVEAYPRVWLPVGSLYWNENDISADISKYFVGTWVRVKDVFILAAGDTYTAKTSGGEASHKLTMSETPSHSFTIPHIDSMEKAYTITNGTLSRTNKSTPGEGSYNGVGNRDAWQYAFGSSEAHNNMSPYYVAYCWKRTA